MKPACWLCDTTTGLRMAHRGYGSEPAEFVCEDCFTTTDDGPCFDDLEPVIETVQADEVDMAALDIPNQPFRTALNREAEAIRQRQIAAAEALLGLPIPRSLRLELRAFEASLAPTIIEHERTA